MEALTSPRALWGWFVLLLVMGVGTPLVPVSSPLVALVGGVVLLLVYLAGVMAIALCIARRQLAPLYLVVALGVALAWWSVGQFVFIDRIIEPFNGYLRANNGFPQWWQLLLARTARQLTALSLVFASMFGGALVARLIKSRNMIGPICAMIALIDIWGVLFGGIVTQLMTNPVTAGASKVAFAPSPQFNTASLPPGAPPLPDVSASIGAGDYLFLGLLFAALVTLGMNWRGAAWLTYPLVAIALLGVAAGIPALPGLLFIGLGVALPNLKHFRYTREEAFALLYAGIFVIILTVALYFYLLHQLAAQAKVPTTGTGG